MARKVHGGRALLNLPGHHSTSSIVAEITDTVDFSLSPDDDGYSLAPESVVRITDCESQINLDFDVQTANQLENSLQKLDTIVNLLLKLRPGLIIEHHRLQDRLDLFVADRSADRLYTLRHAVGKRSEILP